MAFILETCIQSAKSNSNNKKNESTGRKEIARKKERKKKTHGMWATLLSL